jgi:tRNA threonylcarbamoyladenosine biosynthesis protein TsaB
MTQDAPIAIAIETTSRQGSVALGRGDSLLAEASLGATSRHARDLLPTLDELLGQAGLTPRQIDEVYVSVGPGSFTGIRVGVTVARTLAQAWPEIRLVAVPTALAIAENIVAQPWEVCGVLLAAKLETLHGTLIARDEAALPVIAAPGRAVSLAEHLADWPRPIVLAGEGLGYCEQVAQPLGPGVSLIDEQHWVPTAGGVWTVGRRLARADRFTSPAELLPLYARKPEAIRLWQQRHSQTS